MSYSQFSFNYQLGKKRNQPIASDSAALPFLCFPTEAIQHQPLLRVSWTRSLSLYLQNLTTLRTSPVREERKSLGWLYCSMLQITHFAFLEKKSILSARLPDLSHHRMNLKRPGISPPAFAVVFAKPFNTSLLFCCCTARNFQVRVKYPGFSSALFWSGAHIQHK